MAKKRAKHVTETETRMDIRLRVDSDLHDRIKAVADREGNSVAAFIRATVVRELDRREGKA